MSRPRAGIDIGGTFTDAVLLDRASRLHVTKVRTTPADLSRGFHEALSALAGPSRAAPVQLAYLVHGTTVAANALVQGRTARVGLLTTAGFRDVLEIGTQQRPSLYDLREPKPAPLVPRELRLEARERIGPRGEVVEPLERADVEAAAEAFARAGVEALAVSFLFSFANPDHEEEAERLLEQRLPGVPITRSSRVAPEIREYPRTATTALNAALLPLVGGYVEHLGASLAEAGLGVPLHLMQSNGGVAPAQAVARLPVALVASGPAAGIIGAARLGVLAGERDLLTFDMGGTTADVGLVADGEPQLRFRGEVAGHPVSLPQIDVLSVGAGGGSIARVDRFGSLLVGPESAGAEPGPAAYGQGGERATVTDAHIVLGTLDPERFLGGRMALDPEAARRAIGRDIARSLGLGVEEAAAAVVRIADAAMVRALRVVSIARGHDPRRSALVAFGGAGPMHAGAIAEELGMGRIVVPRYPGVTSALGLLLADVRYDLRRTWVELTGRVRSRELRARFAELERQADELLAGAGISAGARRIQRQLDLRYRGQAYELTVPLRAAEVDGRGLAAAERRFHAAHRRAYGHASPVAETEIVTLRVCAGGRLPEPTWQELEAPVTGVRAGSRAVWSPGRGRCRYALHEREALGPGARATGPCIVEQDDSTIVVPAGWTLTVGAAGSAVLEARSGR